MEAINHLVHLQCKIIIRLPINRKDLQQLLVMVVPLVISMVIIGIWEQPPFQ